jgi:hypothetical protein
VNEQVKIRLLYVHRTMEIDRHCRYVLAALYKDATLGEI